MAQQAQSQKGTAAKKKSASGKAAISGSEGKQQQDVTYEERYPMIAEAAYYIAEQRGFEGNMAMDDWLQAEAEVNARFTVMH